MNVSAPDEDTLFLGARQLSDPQERAAWLDNACGGNGALRDRVERLLRAEEKANRFLADNPLELEEATLLPIAGSETVGSMVGRYRLLQKIGEGGCGVVYMADQQEPVRRRVALKIIKLGMDTRQVVARFEAERQALAMMDHPNIARVLDAGATDTGRPYFVMELVRGIRITEYCDQNNLSTRERLDLFIHTAHAIQHAHQKGIIHRDIKPSNVLVTLHDGVPIPKVIDFGIAKATEQRLTDKTLFTQFEQFIGTPAYTSPEQAEMSGLDIDTRTDIYGLGVLLYELLVGKTPFDTKELQQSGLAEMRRIIREVDPVKPSTRLTQLHRARGTGNRADKSSILPLKSSIDRDLDWIVMKCLEKDRTRRYDTASGLAADLRHYLGNEPVTARPPGNFYRFGKLVRRNRLACAAVAAVAMALVAGIAASTWQAARAREAEQQSIAEGESACTVMDFFRRHLLGADTPAADERDKKARLREALAAAEAEITEAFKDRPLVEADIRSTLGASCGQLGDGKLAFAQHERALTLLEKELGRGHPRTVESMFDLAMAPGDYSPVPLFEETLQWQRVNLGPDHAETIYTMSELAWTYSNEGRLEQSLSLFGETLELARTRIGPHQTFTLEIMNDMALVCEKAGRLDKALSLYDEAVRGWQAQGEFRIGSRIHRLGSAHRGLGNLDQAILHLRKAYDLLTKQSGADNWETRECSQELGLALRAAGKFGEFETWCREELKTDPKQLVALGGLVVLLLDSRISGSESGSAANREQEAKDHMADYLKGVRSRYTDRPERLEERLNELAEPLYRIQRFAESESLYLELLDSKHSRLDDENFELLDSTASMARLLSDWAWAERANPVAAEGTGLPSSRSQLPSAVSAPLRLSTLNSQPSPLERAREAEQLLRYCLDIRLCFDADSSRIPDLKNRLGSALVSVAVTDPELNDVVRQAKLAEAEYLLLESHPALQDAGVEIKYRRDALVRLVRLYEAWDKPAKRAEWERALEALDKDKVRPQEHEPGDELEQEETETTEAQ